MRRTCAIGPASAGLLLLAMLATACLPTESPGESDLTEPGEVHYWLDWTEASKDLVQVDGRIKLATDLGYEVWIEEAYISSNRSEIVSCAQNNEEGSGVIASVKRVFKALFGVTEAYAGHQALSENLAALDLSVVEDILLMERRLLGSRALEDAPYCQAHYLAARASNESLDLPETIDMTDRTLYLAGYVLSKNNPEPVPFQGSTDLSNGLLSELALEDSATFVHEGMDGDLDVVILRDLTRILDGVDFDTVSSQAVGWRALDNLILDARIVGSPAD